MTRVNAPPRDAGIDTLRVVALAAGIAAHAAVPYMTAPVPALLWPIREINGSILADFVFWWGRCAQPAMFFLLAGLVAAPAIEARGTDGFVATRLKRVGVPILAGIVFVLPAVAAVWGWGWIASGHASWDDVRSWRFPDPEIRRNTFGPAHLWFLEDLLIISVAFAVVRRWFPRDHQTESSHPILMIAALAAVGVGLVAVRPQIVVAARNTFVPDVLRLVFGATFFLGGAWLAARRRAIARWPPGLVLLALAGASAAYVTSSSAAGQPRGFQSWTLAVAVVGTAWLSILAGLRLVSPRISRWSAGIHRLAALTYPAYVVHLPIIGAAHVTLFFTSWSVGAKAVAAFLFACAGTGLLLTAYIELPDRWRLWLAQLRAVPARTWTTAAVALGIGLRLLYYLRRPDVWHDEAALLVNVIERGYGSLLGPLTYYEAAPPLFLWLQRWIAVTVGDGTWVMRAIPFAASCAALVAMLPMTRVIRPRVAPIAVLLMACSIKLLSHSAEAKPYALDVLLAASVASLFVLTRSWRLSPRVGLVAVLAPVLIWLSYPGIFLVLGVAAALFASREDRDVRPRLAFAALTAAVVVSGLVLVAVPVSAQRSEVILENWQWAFPESFHPLTLLVWGVRSAVGIADYCFRPFGGILLLPIAAGVVALVRRGEHAFVVLLLVPLGLAFVAGIAGLYPFSGSRVMVFALPALAVLAAEGLGGVLARMPPHGRLLRASVLAIAVGPLLVLCGREVVSPARRPDTAAATALVLAARGADDPVASSSWEYRYYLRGLGSAFIPLNERPLPHGERRIWYVTHGDDAEARSARLVAHTAPWYDIASTIDLHGVSVIELKARR